MKIIAAHLLNDYSGSPKVLMQLLKGWTQNNIQVDLHTCSGRTGFLSSIPNINYRYFKYTWKKNPIFRLINLLISQLKLAVNIWQNLNKEDVVYVNTVLPFGAAIAGKIKGCRVIYHLHETSIRPVILKRFLFGIAKWTASDVVYVSNYLAKTEPFTKQNIHILHNAIENRFLEVAENNRLEKLELNNILMVCSLKSYKGVFEFMELAEKLSTFNFRLVLNANQTEIKEFFKEIDISNNVEIFDSQTDLHPFYKWADLVLNLSRPTEWIETFGLTILEGMAYGNPAIVPPVGGVTELITDATSGYLIDSQEQDKIAEKINGLRNNNELYTSLRKQANKAIASFKEDYFIQQNIKILTNT